MLLTGLIKFLERNADLTNHEIRINHCVKLANDPYDLSIENTIVSVSLVKKNWLKKKVWSIDMEPGFKDFVELPDHLCNKSTRAKLTTEAALQSCLAI